MSWFLLGAPWDCSASRRGEAAAPAALRAAGLAELVEADLGDAGTVIEGATRDPETGVLALPATVAAARALTASLVAALRDRPGSRPLVAGGDCSLLLGVVPALLAVAGPVGLWFADGHPDYLDGAASDTGETADMELAILTGDGAPALVSLGGTVPMVEPSAVVLLGHRTTGLDPGSAAEVDRLPAALHRIAAPELLADPAAAGRGARDLLDDAGGTAGGWLHVDLDVLDPSALPAVSYPQAGGPTWEQLAAALAPLAASPRLLGVSVADFRADLDPSGEYAERIVELLRGIVR
ncbi:arginase family protein [Jiangella endophytica]|uniref:arginase family protein n=1 Tax=Jiangella endophytica TaxID=1623398 RepID=UPI0018E56BC2|nr:arginase family protein [Jiangella endophytica]